MDEKPPALDKTRRCTSKTVQDLSKMFELVTFVVRRSYLLLYWSTMDWKLVSRMMGLTWLHRFYVIQRFQIFII